jgi:uncharacterized protein
MTTLALLLSLALPVGAQQPKPRIAVVIDDFGFGYAKDVPEEQWMALEFPVTFAVMPASPRTTRSAKRTRETGHELIIHFPFDNFLALKLPKDAVDPEDLAKVDALLEKAFKQIPEAKGLNNHQSYRGTMNRPMMQALMTRLKPRGIYFLDSMVSAKTVAYDEARKAGIPAAINSIFLDGTREAKSRRKSPEALAEAIAKDKAACLHYLKAAASLARRGGRAIAIGHHYYHGTFQCLKEGVPQLQKSGIEFVFASALTK